MRTQESRTHLRVSVKHLWCLHTVALDNCTRECDTRRFLRCSVAEIGCHSRARVERVRACSTTVGESSTKVVDIAPTFSATSATRVHASSTRRRARRPMCVTGATRAVPDVRDRCETRAVRAATRTARARVGLRRVAARISLVVGDAGRCAWQPRADSNCRFRLERAAS